MSIRSLALCAGLACALVPAATRADVIDDWNNAALVAIQTGSLGPPGNARMLAMMHVAMYDAANSISPIGQSYLPMPAGPAGADRQVAVAKAARDVLAQAFPAQAGLFDTRLNTYLASVPNSQAKTDGLAVGAACATACITHRTGDGSTAPSTWVQGNSPTSWQPTGAATSPQFQQYASVQPWTMNSPSQFRQAAPPQPGSAEYVAAYNEVKSLGAQNSATRTADQTQIARFWAGGAGSVTPPGQWNVVAQTVSNATGQSFDQKLRMFALMNMASADAAVAAWDMKLTYDYFRPVTAIRATDDPTWTPLIGTPQFQAYSSGHSAFSSSAAAVLAAFFGDGTSFSLTLSDPSLGFFNLTRNYTSFSQAAAEAGMSRIFGGIHWQFDNTASLTAGQLIGQWAVANYLVPTPSSVALLGAAGVLAARRRRR